MTYEEIKAKLYEFRLESTLRALEDAIQNETMVLLGKTRRTRENFATARKCACEFYAADITECLYDTRPLEAGQILGHRRKPTAWAIADILRREMK